MDQGLITLPNRRTFKRFISQGLWLPTGSIHGFDLGSILMVNSAYGLELNSSTFASPNGLITFKEPIGVTPEWTLQGNQHHTRIRALLLLGTKQADVTQNANAAATNTLVAVVLGASYDTGWRGATLTTASVGGVNKVAGTDYEFQQRTGMFRVIDGGGIAAGDSVLLTANVPALTREHYTAFDNQNQLGQLKCFGIRTADTYVDEEWVFSGMLYAESLGNTDPKKDREWTLKLSANGSPDVYDLKT